MTDGEAGGGGSARWAAALAVPIIGGALLGMSVVTFLAQPIWGDQPIFLYVADRLLQGASLDIREFADPNPPLITWISMIPVMLGRLLGTSPQVAMELCVAALLAAVIVWCGRLMRRADAGGSGNFVWGLAGIILYAAAVWPWRYYAQREHLLILMILPYLTMAAIRLEGHAPPRWEAVAAGLLAAVGFSLKPFNLAIAAAVEALLLCRTFRPRALVRPEIVSLALGGLAYGGALLLWSPDYLFKIAPMVRATWFEYGRSPLREMIDVTRLAKLLALIVVYLMLRRRLRHEPLTTVLVVGGLAGTASYLIQLKNLEYHFLPGMALFNMAMGVIALDLFLGWAENGERRRRPRIALAAALATALIAAIVYYPLQSARAAANWINDRVTTQLAITAALPKETTLYILSPSTGVIFDMLVRKGLVWGSRFADLWMLPSLLQSEASHAAPEPGSPVAAWTRAAVAEDLRKRHPSIVLVERCHDRSIPPCTTMETLRVDVLAWFQRDPAFVRAWSSYSLDGAVGPYDLWCAPDGADACRRAATALSQDERAASAEPVPAEP